VPFGQFNRVTGLFLFWRLAGLFKKLLIPLRGILP
jgi:hypothetical protein